MALLRLFTWPHPTTRGSGSEILLGTQKEESQKCMITTLMTTTKVDLKHGTRMISLLGLLGELRVIVLVESLAQCLARGQWSADVNY